MKSKLLTRREWILGSLEIATMHHVLLAQQHAVHAAQVLVNGDPVAFEYLDSSAARTLAALAAEIIPSDDGPGAAEAVPFISSIERWPPSMPRSASTTKPGCGKRRCCVPSCSQSLPT